MFSRYVPCCCLAAISLAIPYSPTGAIAGIVVIALASSSRFWDWASCVWEVTFRELKVRRGANPRRTRPAPKDSRKPSVRS